MQRTQKTRKWIKPGKYESQIKGAYVAQETTVGYLNRQNKTKQNQKDWKSRLNVEISGQYWN